MKNLFYVFLVVVVTFAFIAVNCDDGSGGGGSIDNRALITAISLQTAYFDGANKGTQKPEERLTKVFPSSVINQPISTQGGVAVGSIIFHTDIAYSFPKKDDNFNDNGNFFGVAANSLIVSKGVVSVLPITAVFNFTSDLSALDFNVSVDPSMEIEIPLFFPKVANIGLEKGYSFLKVSYEGEDDNYYIIEVNRNQLVPSTDSFITSMVMDFKTCVDPLDSSIVYGVSTALDTVTGVIVQPSDSSDTGSITFDSGEIPDNVNLPNAGCLHTINIDDHATIFGNSDINKLETNIDKGYDFFLGGEIRPFKNSPSKILHLKRSGTGATQVMNGVIRVYAQDGSFSNYNVIVNR